jgi:hypothetical protein
MNRTIQILTIALLIGMTSVSRSSVVYRIDNGINPSSAGGIGVAEGRALGWMNSFQVVPGGEELTSIGIVSFRRGAGFISNPFTLFLWTDPTNDGDPSDAVVVRSTPAGGNSQEFRYFPIEPLTLPVGSWFYAGAISVEQNPTDRAFVGPAIFAQGPSIPNRGFVVFWPNAGSVDPNNLASGNLSPQSVWPIRVNIPEPSSVSLFVVGIVLCRCSTFRRRKSVIY